MNVDSRHSRLDNASIDGGSPILFRTTRHFFLFPGVSNWETLTISAHFHVHIQYQLLRKLLIKRFYFELSCDPKRTSFLIGLENSWREIYVAMIHERLMNEEYILSDEDVVRQVLQVFYFSCYRL